MHILSVQPGCPKCLEDGIARSSSLTDALEVVRPLAYHADCLVSLQKCRNTGKEVAVKTYNKPKLTRVGREQVDTEAYIHASLFSEHIVPLLLAAEDERSIHLIVEWADGGDLRAHIAGISEQRLKDFVVQPLLKALATLDALGVVHRDVKPDNVLVHQGQVLLSDFGLAVYANTDHQDQPISMCLCGTASLAISPSTTDTMLSGASSMPVSCRSSCSTLLDLVQESLTASHADTLSHDSHHEQHKRCKSCLALQRRSSSAELMAHASGTPLYTAPEVLLAMFESRPMDTVVTPKNDVWALGIMVLEALTGCHPYSPRSTCVQGNMYTCNLLYAVAHHRGFKFPSHLSPCAVDFLRAALHTDPKHRASAIELLAHPWLQPTLSPTCGLLPGGSPILSQGVKVVAVGGTYGKEVGLRVRVTAGGLDAPLNGASPFTSPRGSMSGRQRSCSGTPLSTSCKHALGTVVARLPNSNGGAFEVNVQECWEY